jgi:hypothetical protein
MSEDSDFGFRTLYQRPHIERPFLFVVCAKTAVPQKSGILANTPNYRFLALSGLYLLSSVFRHVY